MDRPCIGVREIVKVLGGGSSGTVCKAGNSFLTRFLAVKVMRNAMEDGRSGPFRPKGDTNMALARAAVRETTGERRRKGLLKLGIGIVGAAAMFFLTMYIRQRGYLIGPKGGILFAIPGAFGLAGLLELATGRKFSEISDWWDGLKGWQRGVYGTAAFLIAFTVFCVVLAIVLS
jgi:hypothetical protein